MSEVEQRPTLVTHGYRQHRGQRVNAHTINKVGWKYGLIGNHTMYKMQQKVWQHCIVPRRSSVNVLHHISHDRSMIRWCILFWPQRKQNECRVHL